VVGVVESVVIELVVEVVGENCLREVEVADENYLMKEEVMAKGRLMDDLTHFDAYLQLGFNHQA